MPVILQHSPDSETRIGVWHITEPADVLRDRLVLWPSEEDYYKTIRNGLRRQQWLSYRLLLEELLGGQCPEITYDKFGKPGFVHGLPAFSVSHSGPYSAAIVSTRREVGIDIEKLGTRIFRVSDRFLSEQEKNQLGQDNRMEKTVIHWGIKEALYKLHGRPEVEFSTDIEVEPFEYLCTGGRCSAGMQRPESEDHFEIGYEPIGEYMLVYAMSQLES